jgi:hypothetical protein
MKKVFQTNISSDCGDCARAAVASLFEMEIEDVPDFLGNHDSVPMGLAIMNFHSDRGYTPGYINGGCDKPTLQEIAQYDGGVNGYFYAAVNSRTFPGGSHAVIVDTDLRVVHDPNPNGKCLNLNPEDIVQILTTKGFIINIDGSFVDINDY